jgi:hypothetical protein
MVRSCRWALADDRLAEPFANFGNALTLVVARSQSLSLLKLSIHFSRDALFSNV